MGLGNQLHLVWFVRDQAHIWGGEGAFRYRVWYANRPLDGLAQGPAVFPTLTPTSQVPLEPTKPTPLLTPTPTSPAWTVPLTPYPGCSADPAVRRSRTVDAADFGIADPRRAASGRSGTRRLPAASIGPSSAPAVRTPTHATSPAHDEHPVPRSVRAEPHSGPSLPTGAGVGCAAVIR